MAPEQSDSKRLSQEAHVYSFGVLILEAPSWCERRCGDAARRARLSRAAARAEALHGQRGGSVAGAGERQDDFAVRRSRLRILNIFYLESEPWQSSVPAPVFSLLPCTAGSGSVSKKATFEMIRGWVQVALPYAVVMPVC
jgi:hypothetical protein